jgi:hypothetical protein
VTRLDDLRQEVLRRLRALGVVHPERTVHLAIDIAHHGAALPVPAVLATREDLRERGRVVRVGGGWCVADAPAGNGAVPTGAAGPTRTLWLVGVGGGTGHSVHASEAGARARVAELDSSAAQVARRRLED